jgi:23S rRNA (pseudouridine1915-N3)-methyltransferase
VNIVVAAVGRPRDPRLAALHDEWAERLRTLGIGYEAIRVPETRAGGRYSDAHVRARETRALLDAAKGPGRAIALDPGGTSLTSEEFARRLPRWATPRAVFLVGGPLGLDPPSLAGVDLTLSLSRMTFPHELARAILAEQIYRAATILRGIPYHKGNLSKDRAG